MGEARRKAEKQLARLREQAEAHGAGQRALEALHEMTERLAANYHELEKAVSDRVQLSREVLNHWQSETRQLMREIQRFSAMTTA
jgi:predicted  nucleic acid-binding Zn-ribbon protein